MTTSSPSSLDMKASGVGFRRRILLTAALLLMVVQPPDLGAQFENPDCERCRPQPNGNSAWGTFKVCIAPNTFTEPQIAGIQDGGKWWQYYYEEQGHSLALNFEVKDTNSGDCDMKILKESVGATAQASSTATGHGASIKFSPAFVQDVPNDWARWGEVAGHEFGHIMGFQNVYDDCILQVVVNLPSEMLSVRTRRHRPPVCGASHDASSTKALYA